MNSEIIVQVPLSGFVDTLIFFGAMAISTMTVLWFLHEVTIKDRK